MIFAAWGLLRSDSGLRPDPTSQPTQTALWEFTPGEVFRIEVEAGSENKVVFERQPDLSWQKILPDAGLVSTAELDRSLQSLTATRIIQTLDTGGDRSEFGLEPPQYSIRFSLRDDRVKTLQIGSQTPVGYGYYVSVDGEEIQVADGKGLASMLEWIELIMEVGKNVNY